MRVVVQRVSNASVVVDGEEISAIGLGLMVLVCVETGDQEADVDWLTKKIVGLRIFEDESGVMNLDVKAVGGDILAVSQFTLVAGTRKGNRRAIYAPPLRMWPCRCMRSFAAVWNP